MLLSYVPYFENKGDLQAHYAACLPACLPACESSHTHHLLNA
jgi:hypothetical protein